MRIYTKAGDLPYQQFTFPDGQRHFNLQLDSVDFREATIETRITNGDELLDVLLAQDVLRGRGYSVNLDIRYLLGGRMDRPISNNEPFTLRIVAAVLNNAGFRRIRILDPHSVQSTVALRAKTVMPIRAINTVLAHYSPEDTVLVAPDSGAIPRINSLWNYIQGQWLVATGFKKRDLATGWLSGFGVVDPSIIKGKRCLILDDICDGGGTFTGLANVLLNVGATSVDLFVTHGIFSKGTVLAPLNTIYTTDSYAPMGSLKNVIQIHVGMEREASMP